jgi:hypothetical protein
MIPSANFDRSVRGDWLQSATGGIDEELEGRSLDGLLPREPATHVVKELAKTEEPLKALQGTVLNPSLDGSLSPPFQDSIRQGHVPVGSIQLNGFVRFFMPKGSRCGVGGRKRVQLGKQETVPQKGQECRRPTCCLLPGLDNPKVSEAKLRKVDQLEKA